MDCHLINFDRPINGKMLQLRREICGAAEDPLVFDDHLQNY